MLKQIKKIEFNQFQAKYCVSVLPEIRFKKNTRFGKSHLIVTLILYNRDEKILERKIINYGNFKS